MYVLISKFFRHIIFRQQESPKPKCSHILRYIRSIGIWRNRRRPKAPKDKSVAKPHYASLFFCEYFVKCNF